MVYGSKKKLGKGRPWLSLSPASFWILWHYAEREGGQRCSGSEELLAACSPLLTSRGLNEVPLGSQKNQSDEKKMAASVYELLGFLAYLTFPCTLGVIYRKVIWRQISMLISLNKTEEEFLKRKSLKWKNIKKKEETRRILAQSQLLFMFDNVQDFHILILIYDQEHR